MEASVKPIIAHQVEHGLMKSKNVCLLTEDKRNLDEQL